MNVICGLTCTFSIQGVALSKSSKLKLWLFSAALVELPPELRYRRYNMVLMSLWVSNTEPEPKCWLRPCVDQLISIKASGDYDANL